MASPTRWITIGTGLLGAWLMAAPFVLGAPLISAWNDVVVGGAISLLAGHNHSVERERGTPSKWIAGVLASLGGWLLFAPFVFGVSGQPRWNDVFVGVLVMAFAGYNAYAAQLADQRVGYPSTDET